MDSDNVKRGVATAAVDGLNSKKRKKQKPIDRLNSEKRKKQKAIDRLSSLPDDLIHKILSFVSIQDTLKTMVLSSRYRFIWTTMPCLDFSTLDFIREPKNFVRKFLKRRDSGIEVSSLKLTFRICGKDTEPYVRKIMDYAFSHNIQRLDVVCLFENYYKYIEFPLSLFSSPSLKHLSLETGNYYNLTLTSTWELPSLTTLYLKDVTFCSDDNYCVGLLSKCPNLKNLTLISCQIQGFTSFSIDHPGLSDLTLDGVQCVTDVSVLNVVAPQLENLTIRYHDPSMHEITRDTKHEISAPKLASLAYGGDYPLLLNSTDGFRCLKEADILVSCRPNDTDAHQLVCMLQQLQYVESLKLNLEMIEVYLSSCASS